MTETFEWSSYRISFEIMKFLTGKTILLCRINLIQLYISLTDDNILQQVLNLIFHYVNFKFLIKP